MSMHHFLSLPMQVLTATAIPVDIEDREQLIKAANTSLSSKIVRPGRGRRSSARACCYKTFSLALHVCPTRPALSPPPKTRR